MAKEDKELKISKREQYEFYKSVALSNDPTIPWPSKLQAFERLCELCGTAPENSRKWIIKLEMK